MLYKEVERRVENESIFQVVQNESFIQIVHLTFLDMELRKRERNWCYNSYYNQTIIYNFLFSILTVL
jgi:hypothetical protein